MSTSAVRTPTTCRRVILMEHSLRVPRQRIGRRRLLRGTVVLSLGAIVAGCGGSGDASPSSPSMESDERDGARALGGETIEVWRDPG
jgi:hypothetical protein